MYYVNLSAWIHMQQKLSNRHVCVYTVYISGTLLFQDTSSGFECECPDGYKGGLCDITPCSLDPCVDGSTCVVNMSNAYTQNDL